MQWHNLVRAVCGDCTFAPPASVVEIAEVEAALMVRVPDELAALWRETNGVQSPSGEQIWSAQTVIRQNLELRGNADLNDLYMTFESVLFFAEPGNGDLLFLPIQADGKINRLDIFAWDHETDSRTWTSPNLSRFIETFFGVNEG